MHQISTACAQRKMEGGAGVQAAQPGGGLPGDDDGSPRRKYRCSPANPRCARAILDRGLPAVCLYSCREQSRVHARSLSGGRKARLPCGTFCSLRHPNKFDPSSVYADWALQGVDRGRPAAASSTGRAGGAVVCDRRGKGTRIDGEQAYQGKIPMFWDRKILASPCFGRRVELLPMKLRSRAWAEANSVRERAARS